MTYVIPNEFRTREEVVRLALLDDNFSSIAAQINAINIVIDNLQINGLTTQPGSVMYFAAETAPVGWVKANGAEVSRTAYADLFSVVGTTYGTGNGSTTFNLPDLRGEFLRGYDDARGVDSGRAFGSWQDYDWKGLWLTNTGQSSSTGYSHNDVWLGKSTTAYNGRLFTGYWSNPSAHIGGKWGTEEPRPRNMAMLACIKY